MGEQSRLHGLVELRAGIGVAMHAPLFHDDVALRRDDLVGEHEAGHAIGFELHHHAKMLLGDALEIGGVIIAGEGVLLAAEFRDHFGKLALRMGFGALEHQMFEKMRDARFARRIVGRAVAIPHHMRDDGRAAIGNDDDAQPIVEPEIDDRGTVGHTRRLGKRDGRVGDWRL